MDGSPSNNGADVYNDPTRPMAERVGLVGYGPPPTRDPNDPILVGGPYKGKSQRQVDEDYLSKFQGQSSLAPTNGPNRKDDEDYLSQFEGQGPQQQRELPIARVAGEFEQLPATALEPGLGTPGGDLERLIRNWGMRNPEQAGTAAAIAAGVIAPEFTFARALPWLLKTGINVGGKALGKFTDYEILLHLLRP